MRYLSVCSGIEAATAAWHSLGWQPAGFSEIEPFPAAVLNHHYPHVTNYGDMTRYKEWNLGSAGIDLLVGGTPCQSFSVAGLRKGLDDPRGNLALVYLGIADHFRPRWIVWENVPGVLSSNGGRDFGSFLGALAELGYGFAYRVLDAQYFGVAQRRRRVFVVGHIGDWQRAAAVLFERESLRRDTAPSREAGEEAAKCLTRGACQRLDFETEDFVTQTYPLNSMTFGRENEKNTRQCLGVGQDGDPQFTLSKAHSHAVAHPMVLMDQGGSVMNVMQDGTVGTLRRETHGHEPSVVQGMAVRRLTPVECERLQGFPDNYTNIPWRKKPDAPDGPRYKALGNSMAVPVMAWIGQRIAAVDAITTE